jgi:hypothetical protein
MTWQGVDMVGTVLMWHNTNGHVAGDRWQYDIDMEDDRWQYDTNVAC